MEQEDERGSNYELQIAFAGFLRELLVNVPIPAQLGTSKSLMHRFLFQSSSSFSDLKLRVVVRARISEHIRAMEDAFLERANFGCIATDLLHVFRSRH